MDTKEVKSYKEKLYMYLSHLYESVEKEVTFDWCTSHSLFGVADDIYDAIKSYRGSDFVPERVTKLSCDYVISRERIVLEYDEIQHFTYQRLLALQSYPQGLELCYDKTKWIQLCKELNRRMNKRKDPYRDEKRAFYDSTRDIMIPKHGYKLVRIYHGQIDLNVEDAEKSLREIIEMVR